MAISEDLPGIEVVVEVDGQAATEYDSSHNDDELQIIEQPTEELDIDNNKPHAYVVKYIEAKSGAPFLFRVTKTWRFRRFGHHMAYRAVVDGEMMELDHEHNQEGKKEVKKSQWVGITKGYYSGSFEDPENMKEHFLSL